MKTQASKYLGIALASLLAGQGALADGVTMADFDEQSLFAAAFNEAPRQGLLALDEQAMGNTEGELWPFIFAVATTDLALAGFFWGVYVPTVTGGGGAGCTICTLPGGRPR